MYNSRQQHELFTKKVVEQAVLCGKERQQRQQRHTYDGAKLKQLMHVVLYLWHEQQQCSVN